MNLDKLLAQEPFNKWLQKFIKEYALHSHNALIQPIGSNGFRTDVEITEMFMGLMLKERPGAVLAQEDLINIFYAWYECNSTYHASYAPPKVVLVQQLQKRYEMVRSKGRWCFEGVELTVNTLEEANQLIEENRNNLEFRLPNFRPEISVEEERRRQELGDLERLMLTRDIKEIGDDEQ